MDVSVTKHFMSISDKASMVSAHEQFKICISMFKNMSLKKVLVYYQVLNQSIKSNSFIVQQESLRGFLLIVKNR